MLRRHGPKLGGLLWSAVWLYPLLEPAGQVVDGKVHPALLAGAGLTVFVVLYLAVVSVAFGTIGCGPPRWLVAGLVVLAGLGIGLAVGYDDPTGSWLLLLLFTGVAGAAALPRNGAFAWVAGNVAVMATIGLTSGQQPVAVGTQAFVVMMACALVFVVKQMMGYIRQLRQAQDALAVAAVEQERLRFARDLHDLLGHSLSVIVIKAEVVRRLVAQDPGRAAAAAADIEQIGRQALTEVREAVTGYRERTFAAELDGARAALADAGIEVTVEQVGTPLPTEADALFGWAVREGTTNVIRHSGARRCTIAVRQSGAGATLEIRDDGIGGTATSGGYGLRGLRERLAAAGGRLTTTSTPGSGFQLLAELP
jgi:two-component system sensor histidine kinase DesK